MSDEAEHCDELRLENSRLRVLLADRDMQIQRLHAQAEALSARIDELLGPNPSPFAAPPPHLVAVPDLANRTQPAAAGTVPQRVGAGHEVPGVHSARHLRIEKP